MSANMIVFDSDYTQQQVNNLNNAKQMLDEAIGILRKANDHRSWKCPEVSRINDSLDTINKRLGKLNNGMSDTIKVLNIGVQRFQELESRAENQVNNLSGNLKEKHGFPASDQQGKETQLPSTPIPVIENGIALAKPILSWLDKQKNNEKAGLAKDGLSYLASMYKFFSGDKRGLTGAEDLCNLSDNSIGLWTGIYDYLKGEQSDGIFSIANQRKAAGLGIVGDVFGFVSDIFGIANKINSGDIGTAGVIGEVIGLGENGVDIWGSVEKLKHMGDNATNITTQTGVYSPLTFYSATIKGGVSTISQGFKSVEKYSADGKWDLGDTGRTGIEAGMAGLWAIGDTLSFGGLSAIGKATGISAESIGENIGNWANDVGKRAGNYILNDPGLHQVYNNVGPIGKTAITFHAAFQSGIQSAVENVGNLFQFLFS